MFGYLGPNGAGKSTTIEILLGFRRASAGRAEIFGLDVRRDADELPRARRLRRQRRQPVAGADRAEALRFLGQPARLGRRAYRDDLIDRFQLEADKKVRAYSDGNRQKVLLVAAFATPGGPPAARRAHAWARPADGAGLPGVRAGGPARGQTVFLSSHILSEVDAVCRPGRHAPQGPDHRDGRPGGAAGPGVGAGGGRAAGRGARPRWRRGRGPRHRRRVARSTAR